MSKNNNITKTREFKTLTFEKRGIIYGMHTRNATQKEIAVEIGVSQSTISRELKRGKVVQKNSDLSYYEKYFSDSGQRVCEENKKKRKFNTLDKYRNFIKYFNENYKRDNYRIHSVDTLVWEFKKRYSKENCPCTKTVYNWIDKGYLEIKNIDLPMKTRRRRTNKQSKPKGMNKRIFGDSIDNRDKVVLEKKEVGHLEIDLVLGKKTKNEPCIISIVDVTTRMAFTKKISSKDSVVTKEGVLNILLEEIGLDNVRSITTDNGSEFSLLHELKSELGVQVYYTHAYSAWEKGTNERFNGMLREFIPKGKSMNDLTDEQLKSMTMAINSRPRKVLGYASPKELYESV